MTKLFQSIILSAVLLTEAAAVAPSASQLGPAGKINLNTAAGCSRMPRLIQEAQRVSFKTATSLKLFIVKTI
nr:hypothetical protein [Bacillus amyloliquefaciens]